jgi:hypothetical protein
MSLSWLGRRDTFAVLAIEAAPPVDNIGTRRLNPRWRRMMGPGGGQEASGEGKPGRVCFFRRPSA